MYKIVAYDDTMKDGVVQFLLSILEGEFNHTGIERPDIYSISATYQKDGGNFWVAFDQDKLIGTAGLINYGSNNGYIKRMSVDPNYRGKGIAQSLLNVLLDFAKEYSYKKLYLATSENMIAAQKFYEKEGFNRIPKLPNGFPTSGATIFYKLSLN
ncbi:MAG: GNAT family N-acetyltransferase [Candidatus Magasanikbacteria bacterium]